MPYGHHKIFYIIYIISVIIFIYSIFIFLMLVYSVILSPKMFF